MLRQARTLLLSAAVIGVAGACSAAAPAPLWTYGPAAAAPAAAVATPRPTPSPTVAPTPTAPDTTIDLAEWKVDAGSTFTAGSVTFTIKNDGTIQHELLVFKSDLAPAAYPQASGDIVEDGPGITLLSDGENIDPQGTQQRTVDLTPGTYLFVCNIPGHFKAGMYRVFTVTP